MADVTSRLVLTALDQTAAAFKSAEARADKLADKFGGAATRIAVAGAAAAAAIAALGVKGAQTADEFTRLSQAFGIPTDRLLTLQTAAALTGTSLDAVAKGALKLGGAVNDALIGKASGATAALQRLGITQAELNSVQNDTEGQLRLVSERFRDLPEGIQRTRLAAELFGNKLATQLIPFLNEGSEAITQAEQDLAALGIEVTKLDVSQAELLGDQFDRVGGIINAVGIEIASFAGPRVQALLDLFLESADAAGDLGDEGLSAGQKVDAAIAAGLDTVQTLQKAFLAAKARIIEFAISVSELNTLYFELLQAAVAFQTAGIKRNAFADSIAETKRETEALREAFRRADSAAETAFKRGSFGERFLERTSQNILAQQESVRQARAGGTGAGLLDDAAGGAGAADREREQFRKRLQQLTEFTATETELLEFKFNENFSLLQEALTRGEITEQQFRSNKLALEAKFQEDLAAIREKEFGPQDRLRQQVEERLQAILQANATEIEQRELKLTDELSALEEANNLKILSEEQFQERRKEIIARAEADIQAIKDEALLKEQETELKAREEKLANLEQITGIQQETLDNLFNFQNLGFSTQLGALASFGTQFTGMLAGQSKKAFELQKKFGIAQAIIGTLVGIDLALGSAPPPLNFALAAAVAAKGFAAVAQIRSTQPGTGSAGGVGGGGVSSGSSLGASGGSIGGSSIGDADVERTGPSNINIQLQGRRFDREDIVELVDQINELASDRGNINFSVS